MLNTEKGITMTEENKITNSAAEELPPAMDDKLSHDVIAALAFEYCQSRGDIEGSANDDWLRAERHLTEDQESSFADSHPVAKAASA